MAASSDLLMAMFLRSCTSSICRRNRFMSWTFTTLSNEPGAVQIVHLVVHPPFDCEEVEATRMPVSARYFEGTECEEVFVGPCSVEEASSFATCVNSANVISVDLRMLSDVTTKRFPVDSGVLFKIPAK
ncbi:hypothetical protein J6590_078062 [Homalodisca vitripennis]|nr:hypothetical protein J6590_078062 [Homalodisca vitripennis]